MKHDDKILFELKCYAKNMSIDGAMLRVQKIHNNKRDTEIIDATVFLIERGHMQKRSNTKMLRG
jgi:hypothetical protein